MGSEFILWTTSNGYLTVSSIKRNIHNVCWAEQEGLSPPSGENLGTLVRQSIHRLKPVKFLKGVRDLRCNPKSSVAQNRHTTFFYIYHIDFGLCDRSRD